MRESVGTDIRRGQMSNRRENRTTGKKGVVDHRLTSTSLGKSINGGTHIEYLGRKALRREQCDIHPLIGNDRETRNYITAVVSQWRVNE
jgi:hypothetical protein